MVVLTESSLDFEVARIVYTLLVTVLVADTAVYSVPSATGAAGARVVNSVMSAPIHDACAHALVLQLAPATATAELVGEANQYALLVVPAADKWAQTRFTAPEPTLTLTPTDWESPTVAAIAVLARPTAS